MLNTQTPDVLYNNTNLMGIYIFYQESVSTYTQENLKKCHNLKDFTPSDIFFNDYFSA